MGRFLILCTVHIYDLPSGKYKFSVHSTHFWCTSWKVFCFFAQYTFLMYSLESVVSDPSTDFWFTVQNVFCFCAKYTFLMPSDMLFLWAIDFSFVFCVAFTGAFWFYRNEDISNTCVTWNQILLSAWKCLIPNLLLTSALTVRYDAVA